MSADLDHPDLACNGSMFLELVGYVVEMIWLILNYCFSNYSVLDAEFLFDLMVNAMQYLHYYPFVLVFGEHVGWYLGIFCNTCNWMKITYVLN